MFDQKMHDESRSLDFLQRGGEMGEKIRVHNWGATPVGTPDLWPENLRTALGILVNSKFPMFVWWGKELITFYNDAYLPIAGDKHPDLLGRAGSEAWQEVWHDIEPMVLAVFRGESTWYEDQLLYIDRRGYMEETYFTFSHSPIYNNKGDVEGLFCVCIETTDKVNGARKLLQAAEESRQTTELLRNSNERFELVARATQDAIWDWNLRTNQIWWNEGFRAMFGYDEADIEPGVESWYNRLHPEDKEEVVRNIHAMVDRGGKQWSAEYRFRKKDGTYAIVHDRGYALHDSEGNAYRMLGSMLDITDRKMAESRLEDMVRERTKELTNQRNLLDNILKNSSNGISVTEMVRDNSGKVVDAVTILANDAAVNFTGLPRDVYLSATARQLDPDILESPYGQTCLKTLATGEPSIIQYRLDITNRWLELTISKMDEDHLIHIFTDITAIKETQLQFERSVEDLKRTNANLEEFAYAASHDLKEPIRKIHVFSDRLKSRMEHLLGPEEKKAFERMESATNRMSDLIEDLLTYSQITLESQSSETVDLNQVVREVLDDLELEIEQKKAVIHVDALFHLQGRKRQLHQVFHNLVGNALKYSRSDEPPEITITSKKVAGKNVALNLGNDEKAGDFYEVTVRDNGIGFDPGDAERIFNVFTRLHDTSVFRGTGIGLSIVRKVMQKHSGYIVAESEKGRGSQFRMYFPATTAENV